MTLQTGSLLTTLLSNSDGHLWQSTVCLVAAAMLVLLLRRHSARVRYAIWLAASLKFLVPLAAIARLGSLLAPRSPAPPVLHSRLEIVFETVGVGLMSPVAAPLASQEPARATTAANHPWTLFLLICTAVWICGALIVIGLFCRRWLQASRVKRAATPLDSGREVQILRALEQAHGVRRPIELRVTDAAIEPSVFGVFRPVLLWPAGISAHLDDTHVEAILAHELAHIERRDNLAAAVHLLVQAIFWFHPLVWWLGARLVEEREHACDEAVLTAGGAPEIYAEGLLRTCRFCVESALPCAAGVTGGELRARVRGIMRHTAVRRLNAGIKWLLSAAAVGIVAVPFCFGLAHPMQVRLPALLQAAPPPPPPSPPAAQQDEQGASKPGTPPAKVPDFAVASVKPDKSGTMMVRIMFQPDGFSATNVSLKQLILLTWGVNDDRISGAPSWIDHANYDIEAKVDSADVPAMRNLTIDQRREMVRKLLEERFGLKSHEETKELPVYALVVAKGGPKLHEAKPGDTYPNGFKGPEGKGGAGMMMFNGKQLTAQAVPISNLTQFLSRQTQRTVIDKTGLTGKYDFTLDLPGMPKLGPVQKPADDNAAGADSASEDSGPSIFTLVQDQLGLKLDSAKAPLPVVII
ncbi:MAG TPA: M56 and DUF3738 domain-containing protein, partial [Acidobacteriaceae bacterium]|nr:M56 and DUF3738 domain-containing protein [Acidobacteriaceae bacterium]